MRNDEGVSDFSLGSSSKGRAETRPNARSYKFTGPDGVEYRWAMGAMGVNYPKVSLFIASPALSTLNEALKLVTMDEKKTVVAKFHRAHHITKKQKARLEVEPSGMHMLDHIVLTFAFVESRRRERESSAAACAIGSA